MSSWVTRKLIIFFIDTEHRLYRLNAGSEIWPKILIETWNEKYWLIVHKVYTCLDWKPNKCIEKDREAIV